MNSRRNFIRKTAAGSAAISLGSLAFPKASYAAIPGANDRINAAVIGVRSRGKAHVKAIHADPQARVLYTCDVDEVIIDEHNAWCKENIGYVPKVEKDFRKVLDDKDVHAIFIATPEHWHAPMAIMGLQAGKHVYVEKPCSHNPHENELLVAAQKKYGKQVQMGNQQRSARTSMQAIQEIREGIIGEVYKGEAYYSNSREDIGQGKVVDVPKTLDWDLWQGPAPREKYRDNIHPYNWHWFRTWGTGEVHNNGTHEIDVCRWALGVDLPSSVTSFGGTYTYDDDWEYPDNQQVTFKYGKDKFITWTGHSRGLIQPNQPGRGITIYGSKGVITLSRNGYELYGLDGELLRSEKEESESATTNTRGEGQLDVDHVANFFSAIRQNTELNAPIADGAISTMLCHLGNMAQDAGETLHVDPSTGRILNNAIAMTGWSREYEPGWEPTL